MRLKRSIECAKEKTIDQQSRLKFTRPLKIALIHNFCTHYTVGFFEAFARRFDTDIFFSSAGEESYWLPEHGVSVGDFAGHYLLEADARRVGLLVRFPKKLLSAPFDVYIKSLDGRYVLAVTYLVSRLRRRPVILWTGIWMRIRSPFHRAIFPLVKFLYRHADAIVTYGAHVKQYLISEGVPEARIFIAPHSTDNMLYGRSVSEEEMDSVRGEFDLGENDKVILYVGRFVPEKGLNDLIEAFGLLGARDTVLVLAGTGPERGQLEGLVKERGLTNSVRFTGYVAPERVPGLYSLARMAVLPSVATATFREPWGFLVNEAFNQGVPVVVTETVGAAAGGLVQDEINGLIVPERNVPALASALERLLLDDEFRHGLSVKARLAVQNWSHESMVEGFTAAIDYVTSGPIRK